MNTVEHRSATIPKYVMEETNQKTNELIRAQRKDAVTKLINKRNPNFTTEEQNAKERIKKCTEGLKNSYLSDFHKIYKKLVLWPFVPRLKTSESVDNGGRLVIFLCVALITAFFLYPEKIPGGFKITPDFPGLAFTFLVLIFPNILYYVVTKHALKRCITNANIKIQHMSTSIEQEGHKIENELAGRGLNGMMRDKYGNYIQEEKHRSPIRIEIPFGGHPTTPSII